jgi:hypothetical protein
MFIIIMFIIITVLKEWRGNRYFRRTWPIFDWTSSSEMYCCPAWANLAAALQASVRTTAVHQQTNSFRLVVWL